MVPVPELDNENCVLLSSLDPTVIQHGAAFNLGLHKYDGNVFAPNGHKYIREFNCDTVPTTLYRVGGVLLKKEVVFQHYEDRILIRYTLVDAHSETTLQFRPFLAFRSVRSFTQQNNNVNKEYVSVENGISTCMYEGYPSLFMQFSKTNEFHFEPNWYCNMEYPKERQRGYLSNEDLYVPGYFEMKIKKGESIVFAASTTESKTRSLKRLFDKEVEERNPRDNFFHCLINAAHQFHNTIRKNETYLLAGYPWFKCRARDEFISLPGLTLSIGETDYFERVMKTAEVGLREFMVGKPISIEMSEIDQPDVLLWCIWTLQQYAKKEGQEACKEKYGKLLLDIMKYLLANKHPILQVKENGLVHAEADGKVITWMNSTCNGKPVVPRSGYIVEFNALWFNALMFASEIATGQFRLELTRLADLCKASFIETFWNQYGYLFDYVDGKEQDWSVRPNMVFAAAFDYSPLDNQQKKSILDYCTRELLTPKGLRTLSPKSSGYTPIYLGNQQQRDLAYHQGTAWPWLGGFYIQAILKLYKASRITFVERQLVGYEDEMFYHCLGTLPELFDGNPPFSGRGAISFAMNVAEVLRALELLEVYQYKEGGDE